MAQKTNWVCPKCHALVARGCDCPRCGGARRDDGRYAYRRGYKGAYDSARQTVCAFQHGACALCGAHAADYRAGRWYTRGLGEVHHRVPLSQGGGSGCDNLVLLCLSCHASLDGKTGKGAV